MQHTACRALPDHVLLACADTVLNKEATVPIRVGEELVSRDWGLLFPLLLDGGMTGALYVPSLRISIIQLQIIIDYLTYYDGQRGQVRHGLK